MSALLFRKIKDAPMVLPPSMSSQQRLDALKLSVLNDPTRSGATEDEAAVITEARVIINDILANRNLNNQKSSWIYQNLTRR